MQYFFQTAKENIEKYAPATAQKNINLTIIQDLVFPLPPQFEQVRIEGKVEHLMKLCDELEQTIQQNQKYTQELLHVALKEALEN